MVDEPARARGARAAVGGPVHLFDSLGRCLVVLACALAAGTALAGMPPVVTASTAVLGAIGAVVATAKARASLGPRRSATAIADEVLAATTVFEIEAAVRAEIASWPAFDLSWCALVHVVPVDDPDGLPAGGIDQLRRILASVDLSDRRPRYLELPKGEMVAVTCGASSDLVLVVASSHRITEEAETAFSELAAITGAAARKLALDAVVAERRESARFEELVRFSSDAILIVDAAGDIRYAAPSVTSVLGRWSIDVETMTLADLVVPEHAADIDRFLGSVMVLDARDSISVALRFVRGDGSHIDGEVTGANLLDNRDVRGIVVTVRDVSSRVELERQLRHQAFHDGLTGLANRALFRDRLDRAMLVRREPTDHAPAVAFIDLDDFKRINDSFGHEAGDQALRCVADRIAGCLRGGDTPARLGGDEFAVLIEHVPDEGALIELVQRVIDSIAMPMTLGSDAVVSVAASAGVASCTADVTGAEELLRRADTAMYRAKAEGSQRVAHFEPAMHRVVRDRIALAAELDTAIHEHALAVHYQPIIDLATERIVGVEAFVRWPNRERGLMAPADFLAVAEETGLIVPLGAEVLDTALSDLASWRDLGIDGFALSINVSVRQFLHDDFEATVRAGLDRHGIEPSLLLLEITEEALNAGGTVTEERIRSLVDLGVSVAIDDFGTGQSSLRTLQRLPVGQLKIDRSFVSPLRSAESVVARSIVDLALTLGASAVAEGIEHPDELAALRSLGCGLGQGNLFSAPSSASDVLPLLVDQRLLSLQ